MTLAQLQAIKASIAANTTVVQFGPNAVAIKDLPNNGDANAEIANWYNLTASPGYWVWHTSVSRVQVYNTASDLPSTWNWTTYKNQAVGEQNAWVQMFMGDQASFAQLNVRLGVSQIFTGSAAANAQRDHCFAVGRRLSRNIEKLLAVAVLSPPPNTGNTGLAATRGQTTNPDVMGLEGTISGQDVTDARNLP